MHSSATNVVLLEPYAGKLARTVLREERSREASDLLGCLYKEFAVTTYSEVVKENEFPIALKLEKGAYKWRWINNYYDGPLEGAVDVCDELCFAIFAAETEDVDLQDSWYRRYWVVNLSEEQKAIEVYWHNEFCKYVGEHYTCDQDGKRMGYMPIQPQENWDKFYVHYKEKYKPDFSANEVMGWFEE